MWFSSIDRNPAAEYMDISAENFNLPELTIVDANIAAAFSISFFPHPNSLELKGGV